MTALERLTRRLARAITRNGVTLLTAHDDPAVLAAFKELGWDDPHDDRPAPVFKKATVSAPERAVLPRPEGR